jgi:hypothetical protein
VPLVHHDHVIEAFAAQRAHEPLRDRVRAGCPHRREQRPDAQAGGLPGEVGAVHRIPIAHEVRRCAAPRVALISCRQTQTAVGCAVTAKWTNSRRPCATNTRT